MQCILIFSMLTLANKCNCVNDSNFSHKVYTCFNFVAASLPFGCVWVPLDVGTCSGACVAETGNDAHAAKLLHSLLYTHLLKVDLLSAVEFIDSLVVQANVQSAIESHPLTETPPIQPSFMTFITNTLKSQV